ncbi:MAG: restriction endonuclease subunit S, partial [Methanoregula sp.]|nr:restriction endonuclease subunit S [Methanoregula sp.]
MEVKAGYRHTEVGVIPEDWDVRKLGVYATFKTGPFGSTLHKSDYVSDGVPVINPMHIIDGQIVPSKLMTVTDSIAKQLSAFRLEAHDIIIGRRGDMGRCAVVQQSQVGWLCGTGSMIIRSSERFVPDFLQRILSSPRAVSAIEEVSVGSTMININQGVLADLKVPLPPLPEQRAIATALADVDALITSLDKLIAKKRDIKQAAMQELLTGKRRLPGFSADWSVYKFGDIFQFLNTANNSWSDLSDNGDLKYIHYGDVHAKTTSFLDCKKDSLPLIDKSKIKNIPLVEDGDLVIADASEDYVGTGK